METQSSEDIIYCVRHLIHEQFCDQISPRCNQADNLCPVGGADRFDSNSGLIEGLLIDTKIRVDRTTHFSLDGTIGQGITEDASIIRVGASAPESSGISKAFQSLNKALSPPCTATTEICHAYYSITALRRNA